MFLRPSLPHRSQELPFTGSHLLDKRLVAGFFVLRCPKHHYLPRSTGARSIPLAVNA